MRIAIIVVLTGLLIPISWMPHDHESTFWSKTEQEGSRSPRSGSGRRDVKPAKPAGVEQVL